MSGVTTEQTAADPGLRPMRADASRNRARLVEAARAAFTARGSNATVEEMAKAAGVGVGTLYRHFPRRIDLVEAVYREDVDAVQSREKIAAAAGSVLSRAQAAGVARADVSQEDLMQLVGGMCMARNATLEQNQRLLTFVLDGIRAQPADA